jgi:HlyD family secretion protein
VWVLRDGRPVAVTVRTGQTDGNRTVIISGDLTTDDVVITGSKAGS